MALAPCKTLIESVSQLFVDLRPLYIVDKSDQDFGWSEVSYKVTFQLHLKTNRIDYTLTMDAKEQGYDGTHFWGSDRGTLPYWVPKNYIIKSISIPTHLVTSQNTLDAVSVVEHPTGSVKEFNIVLKDSNPIGLDANHIKVTATINKFTVTSVQNPAQGTCEL